MLFSIKILAEELKFKGLVRYFKKYQMSQTLEPRKISILILVDFVYFPHSLIIHYSGKPVSPMLECLIDFIHEFHPLETISKPQKREKGRKKEEIRLVSIFVKDLSLNMNSTTPHLITCADNA